MIQKQKNLNNWRKKIIKARAFSNSKDKIIKEEIKKINYLQIL